VRSGGGPLDRPYSGAPTCVTPRGLPPDLTGIGYIGNSGNIAGQRVTERVCVTDGSVTRGPTGHTALHTLPWPLNRQSTGPVRFSFYPVRHASLLRLHEVARAILICAQLS
jgi:hypothetical protein